MPSRVAAVNTDVRKMTFREVYRRPPYPGQHRGSIEQGDAPGRQVAEIEQAGASAFVPELMNPP
jgi:hypothetical protein